jgi:uroporphyrinogen decarboxylase
MVDASIRLIFHDLTEYPDGPGRDDWGVEWGVGEEETGAGMPTEHPIQDPGQVEDYPFPDPEKPDLIKPALQGLEDIDRDRSLVFADNGWGIFERSWLLAGMQNVMMWMYEKPGAVRMLMENIAQVKTRLSERLVEEAGVDGIRYGDDWGGESALMMGPGLWRRFVKPQQQKLYDVCSGRGKLIFQHSDGHVEDIVPDLIEMGLDVLNPLQPECNDVPGMKERYGSRLAFHGAVSSRVVHNGSPDEVREEVRLRVDQLAEGGGYLLAPAHGMSYPPENLEAFREAAVEYGKIPAKWQTEAAAGRGDVEV